MVLQCLCESLEHTCRKVYCLFLLPGDCVLNFIAFNDLQHLGQYSFVAMFRDIATNNLLFGNLNNEKCSNKLSLWFLSYINGCFVITFCGFQGI